MTQGAIGRLTRRWSTAERKGWATKTGLPVRSRSSERACSRSTLAAVLWASEVSTSGRLARKKMVRDVDHALGDAAEVDARAGVDLGPEMDV